MTLSQNNDDQNPTTQNNNLSNSNPNSNTQTQPPKNQSYPQNPSQNPHIKTPSSSHQLPTTNIHQEKQHYQTQKLSRQILSILNKLTVEKFDQLSKKLLLLDIDEKQHIELLVTMIFEKAIKQHHFIGMYVGLCKIVDEWWGFFFLGIVFQFFFDLGVFSISTRKTKKQKI